MLFYADEEGFIKRKASQHMCDMGFISSAN